MTIRRMTIGQVRKLLSEIVGGGDVTFTAHCQQRMRERSITAMTVMNVLERGRVREGTEHYSNGVMQWRYAVETVRYRVVATFDAVKSVVVITAIDLKQKRTEE
jgi:hypothetical protein